MSRAWGPAKAVSLFAAIELGARCRSDLARESLAVTSSAAIYEHMRPRLERLHHEEFWVLMLNRANRVEWEWQLSQGGMASTVVDPKLLFKKVTDRAGVGHSAGSQSSVGHIASQRRGRPPDPAHHGWGLASGHQGSRPPDHRPLGLFLLPRRRPPVSGRGLWRNIFLHIFVVGKRL